MADLNVTVTDNGRPVSNAVVRVRLKRHAFRFGGIASVKAMSNGRGNLSAEQYRNLFLRFGFNTAGFGNGLKYKLRRSFKPLVPKQLEWFEKNRIPVRRYCLI